ncbi:fungal-specific transcription factor domain-containing protein, partial [Dissophora ornata]
MFNSPMMLDFNSNSKRSKITKACDNCRRRRVKCDGVSDGCGGCKAAKTQCVYTTSNTKRGPPKGYVEVIEDRLGKIENMLAGIVKKKVLVPPSGKVSASLSEGEDNNDDDDDEDDDDHASVYSTDLVEVKKQPPASPVLQSASVRSNTPTAAVTRSGRSGSVTVSSLGRHSPLVSRNRSLTALLPFSQDSALQHQLAAQQDYPGPISHTDMAALTNMFDKLGTTSVRTTVPFPWLTPEQSRHYGRNYLQFSAQSLEPPLPPLSQTAAQTASLPDVTLELLNSFFDHFNIFLPIIHRPTFMKQWQRESCQLCPHASSLPLSNKSRSKQPQMQQQDHDAHKEHLQHPAAPLSPLLLNALLAVAFKMPSDAQQGHEARQRAAALSQSFFDAARLLLDDFSDVPRVSTVQALCLMSQFHHQGQWKATRNSGYLSMAIRMAHELGLNRDPEAVVGPEADALRYLWWSMFILDHQFSAWLGLSLLMHGKESNVELPMDVSSTQQDLRGFVCMVRLVKILGSVLQHSYSTQSLPPQFGGHDSMVSYIEGSLTSWLSNLAPDMRWHNPNMPGAKRGSPASPMRSPLQQSTIAVTLAPECSELYPAYLYIVYNTTLILLHRPYIVGAAGSPAAAQSNTICTGSGRAITDIAQGLDMEHCSYVVNRFTLYALLQAGVIHAMNAVYDKRGSEVAMEYYKRTLCVLEGFLACAAYSGGVAEGIKV